MEYVLNVEVEKTNILNHASLSSLLGIFLIVHTIEKTSLYTPYIEGSRHVRMIWTENTNAM